MSIICRHEIQAINRVWVMLYLIIQYYGACMISFNLWVECKRFSVRELNNISKMPHRHTVQCPNILMSNAWCPEHLDSTHVITILSKVDEIMLSEYVNGSDRFDSVRFNGYQMWRWQIVWYIIKYLFRNNKQLFRMSFNSIQFSLMSVRLMARGQEINYIEIKYIWIWK